MPNVMAALQNIGGALCSTQQSLADWASAKLCGTTRVPCSNAAKTRNHWNLHGCLRHRNI